MPAIADPEGQLYRGFGLGKGKLGQLLGPSVWARGMQAFLRGHFVGRPQGDVTLMPGFFLVEDRSICWEHRSRHAGDHPDLGALAEITGGAGT